jgi:hypothetical protein
MTNRFFVNQFISAVKDFNIEKIAEEENDVYQRENQFENFRQKQVNRHKQFLEYLENIRHEEMWKLQRLKMKEDEAKFLEDEGWYYQKEFDKFKSPQSQKGNKRAPKREKYKNMPKFSDDNLNTIGHGRKPFPTTKDRHSLYKM